MNSKFLNRKVGQTGNPQTYHCTVFLFFLFFENKSPKKREVVNSGT